MKVEAMEFTLEGSSHEREAFQHTEDYFKLWFGRLAARLKQRQGQIELYDNRGGATTVPMTSEVWIVGRR